MSDKSQLTLVSQAQGFFKELVCEAMERQRVSAQPETEFYIVNLLNQFMTADKLYIKDSEGSSKEEPLAFMLKEALETPQVHAQKILFRHIGDVSLYVAGFFQDSLSRKLVDVDYYIGMGGSAYHHVALRADEDITKALYRELADKFATFVEVLADVSEKTSGRTQKDILRLYELWVKTRSERAAKALQQAGILPNETIKKAWQ